MAPRLEFTAVSKSFDGRAVLDRLTLALEPGEILGFLGPNGAGKTTAIHLALGFLRPSSGTGSLLGRPFGEARARSRLGFVPDLPVFFAESAYRSVAFAAHLNGVRDAALRTGIRDLLAAVDLPNDKKDARKFSRGMQQRLALAQAFINDPELLILDEPASALDPAGVQQVRELLRQARRAGKSVFFSSHQLTEVEQICDRIAFLHEGRLVRQGTLDALLTASSCTEARIRGLSREEAARVFPHFLEPTGQEEEAHLRLSFPSEEQRKVIERVWNAGGEIVSLAPAKRRLEDLFLEWSGRDNARSQAHSASGAAE